MATTKSVPIKDLIIDLHNFRTVPQQSEVDAVKAMISISPDYFWGLMQSLLDDGYLPTENILVILDSMGEKHVKEGNRRVASLKIILGLIDTANLDLPKPLVQRISEINSQWVKENSSVPCTLYKMADLNLVDRIVTRTHGKGTKAGRDDWEAVARARHNRDKNKVSEVALDLLEKYLAHGTNITAEQRARWAGKYNLTVLDEAIKKTAPRFGSATSPELVRAYPAITYKKALDDVIHAIGMETLTFTAIRESPDFILRFGVPPLVAPSQNTQPTGQQGQAAASNNSASSKTAASNAAGKPANQGTNGPGSKNQATGTGNSGGTSQNSSGPNSSSGSTTGNGKTTTTVVNDQRSVRRSLRALTLFGQNRAKLATLRAESLKLELAENPIAFCFLLRSMFEISAKAYCDDHSKIAGGPTAKKPDGSDKTLASVLIDIITHLTQNKKDMHMVRVLHGPGTEIARHDGILSITSMNQLVHNPTFIIQSSDIPTLFSNIFPLLDHMNK